jgi:hypothetical protein
VKEAGVSRAESREGKVPWGAVTSDTAETAELAEEARPGVG